MENIESLEIPHLPEGAAPKKGVTEKVVPEVLPNEIPEEALKVSWLKWIFRLLFEAPEPEWKKPRIHHTIY